MRIAFIIASAKISGGTNVVIEHALGMKKKGQDITIMPIWHFEDSYISWHPDAGELKWEKFDDYNGEEFDVVIATYWETAYYLYKINAKRYVYFVQSRESYFIPTTEKTKRLYIESTYTLPLFYITEANWVKDFLKNDYNKDACLVENGIRKDIYVKEGEVIDKRKDGRLRVLVEGDYNASIKNVKRTLELCRKSDADEVWLLTNIELKKCENADRVFSGVSIFDTPKIYRSCDVLVKLSYVEGMFGPPLEMFHCGGTAVVYDVTGHDMYIKHDYNAMVVKTGDEDRVIEYINMLKRDKCKLDVLKKNALKTADKWPDWDTQSLKFEKALKDIITSDVYHNKEDIKTLTVKHCEWLENSKNNLDYKLQKIKERILRNFLLNVVIKLLKPIYSFMIKKRYK